MTDTPLCTCGHEENQHHTRNAITWCAVGSCECAEFHDTYQDCYHSPGWWRRMIDHDAAIRRAQTGLTPSILGSPTPQPQRKDLPVHLL